jgi:hypothetical protein
MLHPHIVVVVGNSLAAGNDAKRNYPGVRLGELRHEIVDQMPLVGLAGELNGDGLVGLEVAQEGVADLTRAGLALAAEVLKFHGAPPNKTKKAQRPRQESAVP